MSAIVPGKDGDRYVPYEERTGKESVVYFTRDLSPEGLLKIFECVSPALKGKIAIKLHTGEAHGPNIIPRPFVRKLIEEKLSLIPNEKVRRICREHLAEIEAGNRDFRF